MKVFLECEMFLQLKNWQSATGASARSGVRPYAVAENLFCSTSFLNFFLKVWKLFQISSVQACVGKKTFCLFLKVFFEFEKTFSDLLTPSIWKKRACRMSESHIQAHRDCSLEPKRRKSNRWASRQAERKSEKRRRHFSRLGGALSTSTRKEDFARTFRKTSLRGPKMWRPIETGLLILRDRNFCRSRLNTETLDSGTSTTDMRGQKTPQGTSVSI